MACSIDHSREDVIQKLESQRSFLPEELARQVHEFLQQDRPQDTLNELFHLVKKYDLSSKEEQERRNEEIVQLIG